MLWLAMHLEYLYCKSFQPPARNHPMSPSCRPLEEDDEWAALHLSAGNAFEQVKGADAERMTQARTNLTGRASTLRQLRDEGWKATWREFWGRCQYFMFSKASSGSRRLADRVLDDSAVTAAADDDDNDVADVVENKLGQLQGFTTHVCAGCHISTSTGVATAAVICFCLQASISFCSLVQVLSR